MAFLGLPAEIREQIFIDLFLSTTIHYRNTRNYYYGDTRNKHYLAILHVCRQIYREARPLALRHVHLCCRRNANLIEALTRMGPDQVPQLRRLTVEHSLVGFKLFPSRKELQAAAEAHGDAQLEQDPEGDSDFDGGLRYFHLGAVLGLFPGLQLDLLQVFCGVGGGPYTGLQTTDCFGSLLEADGYRTLWMEATTGDGDAWVLTESSETWKEAVETKLKPHDGWEVRIKVPWYSWDEVESGLDIWNQARDAGIVLVRGPDGDEDEPEDEDDGGYECEDDADIVIKRGNADFVVKADDRVLRCVGSEYIGDGPGLFERASDALKKLFRENSWEAIKAMDGFDDGTLDSWNDGDAVYSRMW